jgi:diguanylate cyclase (GGDEF)-like protein/PAS domain S-box-containing protein
VVERRGAVPAPRDAGLIGSLRRHLPTGSTLPDAVWKQRHRGILTLLWLHIPVVATVAVAQGVGVVHAAFETSIIVLFAVGASLLRHSKREATIATAVGLLTCSAELVHLTNGLTEMHFHYFVMIGVITLYQDWWPFLVAIGYVVFQHGLAGAISPESVYNHQAAIDHPWEWAGIHGAFILGMSAAGIVSWKLNERLLEAATHRDGELRETLSLLNATLDATADGILVVDLDGHITSFNERFTEMWGIPADVLDSRDDTAALTYVLAQLADPDSFVAKVRELYSQPDAESYDTIEFSDGRFVDRFSKPQRVGGEIVGRVWSFRDISEHKRLESELAHQAFHDSLTHLPNQALFRDRLGHALARATRVQSRLAVLFIDIDKFKTVNDSLGHTVGDQLLVAVTERLEACVRGGDTTARLGGDEFVVLLEDVDGLDEATAVSDRIIAALRRPFRIAGTEVFIGASIGVCFDAPGAGTDQILRNADLAMYTAKLRGRGRAEVFEPEMHHAAVERLELEADLRRACARDEFVVHYQPIVEVATGLVKGVEALVRWQHPTRGLHAPGAFIPQAQETGMIVDIGRMVLRSACHQTRAWQLELGTETPLFVSVNLAPRQLLDRDLLDDVASSIERSGIAPGDLILEITESAMMHDPDATVARLVELKDLGVRLAVDDFGTGYSSLSYLERFPIDILKIDQSFVAGLSGGAEESALARAIVRLAHTLQLTPIAEGVETQSQHERLRELGCGYEQGYHLCRPQDAEALGAALRANAFSPTAA